MSALTPAITPLRAILADLRERRLWPVAAVLLIAIIAAPLLLSRGAKPAPVAPGASTKQLAPPTGLPVLDTGTSSPSGPLTGPSRDPFTQLAGTTGAGGAATTLGAVGTGTTNTAGAGAAGAGAGSATGQAPVSTPIVSPGTVSTGVGTATIPTGKPRPAPAGLTATQSYQVKLSITNASGGLDTIHSLERLSVLPDVREPLLVELGVLEGGSRVLFAVQPGAVVGGPGRCIPGPLDCQILSLAQDRIESVSARSAAGTTPVALFAVTGITAVSHGSVAAADRARQASSAAGRALLAGSTSAALQLFRYDAGRGVLVDLRNLTVGVG
jgi:hypothetical protein